MNGCYHGGAFFEAIGVRFDALHRSRQVISADVLDAWFEPAPRVLRALRQELPWLLRTSPPAGCEGFIEAVAETRGLPAGCILPGAGSSDLIFRALRQWLTPASRVLILDPMYGEYRHVLERVIGCRVRTLPLRRSEQYEIDADALRVALRDPPDLVILVNPNSPTGRHLNRERLAPILAGLPLQTRVWIDETYIEYVGAGQSLECFAAGSGNVVVCKSMSKVYALSGARAAYLVGPAGVIEPLRRITPPWAVSLPAQVAAVRALESSEHYERRWAKTHQLRKSLAVDLARAMPGVQIIPSVANFLLCHLPDEGPDAAALIRACRERGLFLRDAGGMGRLGRRAVRIAVKDAATNRRIAGIIQEVRSSLCRRQTRRPLHHV